MVLLLVMDIQGSLMITYYYEHPKTKKVFAVEGKSLQDAGKPHKLEDGTKCKFIPWYLVEEAVGNSNMGVVDKNAEVWEKDPAYVKKLAPKYVRRRDGVKEKYDPTRHR